MPDRRNLRIWAVIADGPRIRIFRTLPRGDLLPVFGGVFARPAAAEAIAELGTDRRGRSWTENPLALDVAAFIRTAADDDQFDQLVLIAPPPMLAALRSHLGAKAAACLVAEVDRDLDQLAGGELAARVTAALAS